MRRLIVWALLLVPLMVLVPTGAAQAAAIPFVPPGLPVVTVLPSTIVGAAGGGLSTPETLTKLMLTGATDGSLWKLVTAAKAAQAAGTATSTEVALLASTAAKFSPMATRLAIMSKAAGVAGPAAVLVTGFVGGLAFGDTASRFLGFNDNMVCAEQNGVLTALATFTNSVDCTGYNNALTAAQRNFDQALVQSPSELCLQGVCAEFVGWRLQQNPAYSIPCFTVPLRASYPAGFDSWDVSVTGTDGRTPDTSWAYNQGNMHAETCPAASAPLMPIGVNSNWAVGATFASWKLNLISTSSSNVVSTQHVSTPSELSKANPDRTFQCKVTNTDGTSAVMFSKTFTEGDPAFGMPECPAPAAGTVPDKVEIGESTGGTVVPLITQPTTPQWKASRTTYPNCGTGLCALELWPTATPATSCHADPTACAGWFKDPNKGTNYKCTYGEYAAPLSECTTYAPTFEPAAPTTGQTLGNPETGLAGPQTSAIADTPSGQDSTGRCFPSGWGVFNPVEWVMKPVACALEWAFVPAPTVIPDMEANAKKGWDESTPGQIARDIAVSMDLLGTVDGDCSGILINFPTWNATGSYATTPEHVLAACPGDYFAKWAPLFSVFIGGGFTVVGLLGAKRMVSALFGFHDPGVSV